MSDSESDDEFFDCEYEPVKYYAVAYQKDKGKGIVTTDINEARNKLKNSKGCRFTSFDDPLVAKRFAEKPLSEEMDPASRKKSASSSTQKKVSDPFPNVSPRDLNCFKSAIEKGQLDDVKQIIWNNPRHLVTESDSPTLLQVRFRHNALHVAVSFNRADVVAFLLHVLGQLEFWHSIYPTADEPGNRCRMIRVLDMYVNAPEVGNLETPLHLASKFGHRDCLRALLGQELTDTTLKNKFGFRADEVVCQRYTDMFKEQRSQDIRDIFSEKYVVLLGTPETCRVLPPMSHCDLLDLLRQHNNEYRLDPISSPLDTVPTIVRAYIGPIRKDLAVRISERWITATGDDARRFGEARRSDAEKGMECHGRYLAQECGAPWRELWHFLDEKYTDLGTEEGLALLDEHLNRLDSSRPHFDETTREMPSILTESEGSSGTTPDSTASNVNSNGNSSSGLSGLVRQFLRLTLGSPGARDPVVASLSPVFTPHRRTASAVTPPVSSLVSSTHWPPPPSPATGQTRHLIMQGSMVTSTPLRPGGMTKVGASRTQSVSVLAGQRSLRVVKTPFNASLSGAGLLTPTDRQVRLAVLGGPRDLPIRFPRVADWLHSLDEIDPIVPSGAAADISARIDSFCRSNGFLSASTPIKRSVTACQTRQQAAQHPGKVVSGFFKVPAPTLPDLSRCLSPLSRIELDD